MAQSFVGEILLVPYTFAPAGYAFCDGSLLPISQYSVVFDLIGTTYGGDGQTNFALPDLRGRVPIHEGQSPGLSNYVIGQTGGSEGVALTDSEMPAHNHAFVGSSAGATSRAPAGAAVAAPLHDIYSASSNTTLAAGSIGVTGIGDPHENRQPILALNFVFSLFGIFPSQN